jgi:hypothetical protein
LDACVLIDFWDADPSTITLVARHLGDVHIAENVLTEVEQVDRSVAVAAGITIIEPTFEMMTAAAQRRRGLSFQHHLCLLLAKERGWTCVSNDGRLRAACGEDGVAVLWGLEMLAQVVEAGGLPVKATIDSRAYGGVERLPHRARGGAVRRAGPTNGTATVTDSRRRIRRFLVEALGVESGTNPDKPAQPGSTEVSGAGRYLFMGV